MSGGVYYAVMGVHAASPLMAEWHHANVEELHLPELYDMMRWSPSSRRPGSTQRSPGSRFASCPPPAGGTMVEGRLLDWLDYYCDQKLLLRFSRVR